ncbi:hypothetical protein ACFQGT_01030 [Natrialbaceae archaeon GCM10025810]|uniref:DUF7266 family protein n=1 Tax=Halovalidus salilacus TaxID=3075124 RepID=UPI003623211D
MTGCENDGRERGLTPTVTHVLTLGITAILIAGLMMAGSTMLETETDRSAEGSLETVGERVATEIAQVDRLENDSDDTASMRVSHPRSVANSGYTITLLDNETCEDAPLLDGSTDCVRLEGHDSETVVHVPVKTEATLEAGESVRGGTFVIRNEGGNISIEADR